MNHLTIISSFPLLQLIFFFFFFFFMGYVGAQNPSYSTESTATPPQDSASNFQPSLAVVIGMLSIMFSLTFILLLYAKFCHRTTSYNNMGQQIQDGLVRSRSAPSGVDKIVVESLPFFRFSSLKGSRGGLECSVCLAKFEDIEILRLLPKCKHAFHIDCIDQWLEKHSTCPLCRHKVSADDLGQMPYSNSLRFLWNQSELREDSNIELYVQREEENLRGSSRFSIGSSFRKIERSNHNKEEELPIQQSMDCEEHDQPLHKFNHKIVVSDVVLKNRWSNVSSSDLMFLSSEMINDVSSVRFSSLDSRIDQKSMGVSENGGMMNIKQEMERKRLFEDKIREIKQSDYNFSGSPTTSDSDKQNSGFESKALNQNDKRSMSEITVHPRSTELRNKDSSVAEINVQEERMRRLWLPIARNTVQWFANRERRPPQPHEFDLQRLNV